MRMASGKEEIEIKKGPWSPEEDEKLVAYIKRYGIWNWSHMPKPAGLARSGKSCRLRWMNYLRPNIKRGNFSKEEEKTILSSQALLGNKWSAIAAKLPGRTDNEIKNYWHAHLKKRLNSSSVSSSTAESETEASKNYSSEIISPLVNNFQTDSCMDGSFQSAPQSTSYFCSSSSGFGSSLEDFGNPLALEKNAVSYETREFHSLWYGGSSSTQ